MHRYAKYQPEIVSTPVTGVGYRMAEANDAEQIARLTAMREGTPENFAVYLERISKELSMSPSSWILVAEIEKTIVGFGRAAYFDTKTIKPRFPSPSGWYLMGVIVKPEFRRKRIADALTKLRIARISKIAQEVYFVVNAGNRVSIELHEQLGFIRINEAEGFLNISFEGNKGYLFKKEIQKHPSNSPRIQGV
jgi:ribosomal protein S18 acetylase RimI-like enzyme